MKSKKALKSTYCHPEASLQRLCCENDKLADNGKAPLRLRLNAISYQNATNIAPELGNKACCIFIGK